MPGLYVQAGCVCAAAAVVSRFLSPRKQKVGQYLSERKMHRVKPPQSRYIALKKFLIPFSFLSHFSADFNYVKCIHEWIKSIKFTVHCRLKLQLERIKHDEIDKTEAKRSISAPVCDKDFKGIFRKKTQSSLSFQKITRDLGILELWQDAGAVSSAACSSAQSCLHRTRALETPK